jgi:protein disulfide-isomerase
MEGYCPVTLVQQQQWVQGDRQWGAIHEGRLYLFAGQQQQQQFLSAYGQYAPMLAGHDPVKFLDDGLLVEGRRAHGVFYRDEIYLFADEASLQTFWSAPERYSAGIRAAQRRQSTAPTR